VTPWVGACPMPRPEVRRLRCRPFSRHRWLVGRACAPGPFEQIPLAAAVMSWATSTIVVAPRPSANRFLETRASNSSRSRSTAALTASRSSVADHRQVPTRGLDPMGGCFVIPSHSAIVVGMIVFLARRPLPRKPNGRCRSRHSAGYPRIPRTRTCHLQTNRGARLATGRPATKTRVAYWGRPPRFAAWKHWGRHQLGRTWDRLAPNFAAARVRLQTAHWEAYFPNFDLASNAPVIFRPKRCFSGPAHLDTLEYRRARDAEIHQAGAIAVCRRSDCDLPPSPAVSSPCRASAHNRDREPT